MDLEIILDCYRIAYGKVNMNEKDFFDIILLVDEL